MSYINLHPAINNGLKKGDADFKGGDLECHCSSNKVVVTIKGNVAHNHACGCSKCWKPAGALFSIVGVVPKDNLSVTSNADKLHIVDANAAIQRHACKQCGVHLFGRIVKDHPFLGLDFIHTELSPKSGWQEPQFAAFVSSIIEQGFDANKMDEVRAKLRGVGLDTYDCLSPALMDLIAAYTAKSKLTDEQTQAVKKDEAMKPEVTVELQDAEPVRGWGRLWAWLGIVKQQKSKSKL